MGKEERMTAPNDPGTVDPKGEDPTGDPTDPAQDPTGDPEDKGPELGDAGKRAIDAMKRERNQARKELADALKKNKEYADKDKTESQRLQEAAEDAKVRAATAEVTHRKLQTALDRAPEGASLAHIKAVAKRLSGESDEELEADADELFALLAPAQGSEQESKKKLPGKPKENLSGGGDPGEEPEEKDPRKLADLIGRR
jgi:hypothetical protein